MEGEGIARQVTLNDGNKMPIFGLGVYRASPEEAVKTVKFALQSGCRLIDTAAFYESQEYKVDYADTTSGYLFYHYFDGVQGAEKNEILIYTLMVSK